MWSTSISSLCPLLDEEFFLNKLGVTSLLSTIQSFKYYYMMFSKPWNRHNGKEQIPFVKDKQHSVVFKSCIIETVSQGASSFK